MGINARIDGWMSAVATPAALSALAPEDLERELNFYQTLLRAEHRLALATPSSARAVLAQRFGRGARPVSYSSRSSSMASAGTCPRRARLSMWRAAGVLRIRRRGLLARGARRRRRRWASWQWAFKRMQVVQVSLLMANCRGRLREAAARGSAHPLDDVPFDPDRFVPRPVEHECACHLDASDGEEAVEEALLFGEDVGVFLPFGM